MRKSEFATIAAALRRAYGSDKIMSDEASVDLWYGFLKDLDYVLCQNAVMQLISTSKWPPTIAEIREACVDVLTVHKDWSEDWEKVVRAIGHYGMNREEEALKAMGEDAARIVRRMGWRNICLSDNISVERANFRTAYNSEQEYSKKMNAVPSAVRRQLEVITQNTVMGLEGRDKIEGTKNHNQCS